ncbi:uncharacterized protein LOC111519265 isoform X2 [Drosophila willistoni]|uniref:uncharacterized protein LOC111519265 isoform X2 n=1 Tax=Drosophila willistoni TaxID=7260 RepID=UPI000C26C19D|nr:uncharacterized protein LOC111519265 isoform X2 [Drosophila willistoni]
MANGTEHEYLQAQSSHSPQSVTIHLTPMTPTSTAWPTTKTAGQISVHAIPLHNPMTSRTQPSQQGPPLTFSYGIPNALQTDGVCPRQELAQVGKECSCPNPPMNALPSMCCLPIPIPAYSSEDSGNAVTASTPTPGPGQSLCYQVQYMFCPDSTKPELEGESEAELSTPGSFNDVRGDEHCRCCGCCRSPQGRKGLRKSKVNKRTIKEEMERPQRFTASNTSIQVEHLKLICESLGRALAVAATAAVDAAASKYAPSPTTSAPNSPPNYSAKSSLFTDGPTQTSRHRGKSKVGKRMKPLKSQKLTISPTLSSELGKFTKLTFRKPNQ